MLNFKKLSKKFDDILYSYSKNEIDRWIEKENISSWMEDQLSYINESNSERSYDNAQYVQAFDILNIIGYKDIIKNKLSLQVSVEDELIINRDFLDINFYIIIDPNASRTFLGTVGKRQGISGTKEVNTEISLTTIINLFKIN